MSSLCTQHPDRHWKVLNHSLGAQSTLFPWCCLLRKHRKVWREIFFRTVTEMNAFQLHCSTAAVQFCYANCVMASVLQQQGFTNTSPKCLLHPRAVVGSYKSTESGHCCRRSFRSHQVSATSLHLAGAETSKVRITLFLSLKLSIAVG